jgi:hypothetical protein
MEAAKSIYHAASQWHCDNKAYISFGSFFALCYCNLPIICFTEAVKKTKEVNLHWRWWLSLGCAKINYMGVSLCWTEFKLWSNNTFRQNMWFLVICDWRKNQWCQVVNRFFKNTFGILSLHWDKLDRSGRYDLNSRNWIVCSLVKSEDDIPSTSNGFGSFRYNSCTFV